MRKKYYPSELLLQLYNLFLMIFIMVFHHKIENAALYLVIHVISAIILHSVNYTKQHFENLYLNFFLILTPVLLFSFYHFESGMINLVVFPNFFDSLIQKWDLFFFGKHYHEIWAKRINSNFVAQMIHFCYASYYVMLVIPAFLLTLKERKKSTHWQNFILTRQLVFSITFTMLVCYLIFILLPVKGPTDYHKVLFPEPTGIVKIMDFLYAKGDSDGGAFPSSHVAVSFVILISVFQHLKKIRWPLLVFFIFLIIGTVYCSYHYLIDLFAGLLTGLFLFITGKKLFFFLEGSFEKTSS
ncbi:MAG: phosphatase PAP2 family protein [Candidatus Marinimicrobia bacterium]|nr:phosphatase PAP2 family protein [Candidatus Neomarinimicrobiota bacterium]